MSEFGRRYDGKPFTEGDYRIISGGGGDPDNDGVITEQEWSDWMLSKGATPGFEDEYAKRIQEVAAALGNNEGSPAPFINSMGAPPRNYLNSISSTPLESFSSGDRLQYVGDPLPEAGGTVYLGGSVADTDQFDRAFHDNVIAKGEELARQRYRETTEQFEQTLRDQDVGLYNRYIKQLSNDYAKGTPIVINPLGNTIASSVTDSDGTVRPITLADRQNAARSAFPVTSAMLDSLFGDATELPFAKFEKIYETFNNIPEEQTRSALLAAEEEARGGPVLTPSETAKLLRDINYDIMEGVVDDLIVYEEEVSYERSQRRGFYWEDFVDPDQKNKMTGGRYSTVTRDPYNFGELTVDTDGDGIPDAEAPLTRKRQYDLQKMYETHTDEVKTEANRRRQEDINEKLPIENANFEGKSEQEILDYIDDKHRNEEELEALAAEAGYELTDANRAELIGNSDEYKDSNLKEVLDDLVITEEELEGIAQEQGYELSNADRRKYIGQTDLDSFGRETTVLDAYAKGKGQYFVASELDSKATTLDELRRIASQEGIDFDDIPDEERAALEKRLVGNVSEESNYETLDKLGTNRQDVKDVYKKRTGIDLSNADADELLKGVEAGVHGLEGGNVSDKEFEKWAKDTIELDLGVQIKRMGTTIKDRIFGQSDGTWIPEGQTTPTPAGASKTVDEILANILGVDNKGEPVSPKYPGITLNTTGAPGAWNRWLEILIPVPVPIQGTPLKIGLWENGKYVGPGNPLSLIYNAGSEIVSSVVDGVLQTVGKLKGDVFSVYEAGTDIVRAVIPMSALYDINATNANLPEDQKKPLYNYDKAGNQVDDLGNRIDQNTGLPIIDEDSGAPDPGTDEPSEGEPPGTDGPGTDGPGDDPTEPNQPGDDPTEPNQPGDDPTKPNQPGDDEPGTDGPGIDGPGTDEPGTDGPGTDGPGTDGPGIDGPGIDGPGIDGPGTDGPGDDDPPITPPPGLDQPGPPPPPGKDDPPIIPPGPDQPGPPPPPPPGNDDPPITPPPGPDGPTRDPNFDALSQQITNQGLLGLIGSGNLDPLTHTISAPSVANINYVYDPFGDNIFATEQQAALFGSPYGSGQNARQQQIAQEGVKRSNAVGFGGLAAGGEIRSDGSDLDYIRNLVGRPGGDVTQAEYDGIVTALAEDAIVTSNQKLEINAKRNNAVGFGGLAAGGEVKYDFNDRVARIMSYGDEQ